MADTNGKVVTLICERAVDLDQHLDEQGRLKDEPNVSVVKFPCSGMIQPLMIEAAMKAGASGVIVCGCQLGDCYYREGNKMIRERLLGQRPPGLKKTVDRRRVIALWLARPQIARFLAETKEFVGVLKELGPVEAPQPAKPATAPAAAKPPAAEKTEPGKEPPAQKAEPAKAPAAEKAEKKEPAPAEATPKPEAAKDKGASKEATSPSEVKQTGSSPDTQTESKQES